MSKKSKSTGLMLLMIAIVLGILSFVLTLSLISNVSKEDIVLVAKVDIEKGDPLSLNMFEERRIHPSGKPETAVNKEELNLLSTVASSNMLKEDILREEHIVKVVGEIEDLPLISTRLKTLGNDELLGVEIPIDSIKGMLSGIKKGDMVTIVNVYEDINEETKEREIKSKTILVNIEVVDIKVNSEENTSSEASAVVGLTQDEFNILSLARDTGSIHIAVQPLGVVVDDSFLLENLMKGDIDDSNTPIGEEGGN